MTPAQIATLLEAHAVALEAAKAPVAADLRRAAEALRAGRGASVSTRLKGAPTGQPAPAAVPLAGQLGALAGVLRAASPKSPAAAECEALAAALAGTAQQTLPEILAHWAPTAAAATRALGGDLREAELDRYLEAIRGAADPQTALAVIDDLAGDRRMRAAELREMVRRLTGAAPAASSPRHELLRAIRLGPETRLSGERKDAAIRGKGVL